VDEDIDAGEYSYTSDDSFMSDDSFVSEDIDMGEDIDMSEDDYRNNRGKRSTHSSELKKFIYISLMIVGVVLATAALRIILSDVSEDAAARNEYVQIRTRFPDVSGPVNDEPFNVVIENVDEDDDIEEEEERERELREHSLDELAAINGDFIGWINALHSIDYPVVRGRDNERYINTTFFGSRNSAGTIFMDYRHARGFEEHVVILYGHRTRDGSMFTALESYLTPEFMRRNPYISITTRDGSRLTYTVFAAIITDAWDAAYTVGVYDAASASEVFPNAPQNASQFLLLSTCTRGNNDNERLLVYAALT
jgi:sortase B